MGYHFVLVEGSLVPKQFGSVPGLKEMSYVEAWGSTMNRWPFQISSYVIRECAMGQGLASHLANTDISSFCVEVGREAMPLRFVTPLSTSSIGIWKSLLFQVKFQLHGIWPLGLFWAVGDCRQVWQRWPPPFLHSKMCLWSSQAQNVNT